MLLNKQAVRMYIMDELKRSRPGWKATRVSSAVYIELEQAVMARIRDGLHRHMTVGHTVQELR